MGNFIRHKSNIVLITLILLLFCFMILSSTLGAADISFTQALKIITGWHSENISDTHRIIVLKIRMPRIFLAALVGIGLSIVGGTFQGLFKNPLADPYVLGISSGAGLGATLAIIFSFEGAVLGFAFNSFCAFIGALLTALLVFTVARVGNTLSVSNMLLAGMSVSFFMSSIISILMIINRNQIEKIMFWLMGSVSTANWNQVIMASIVIITAMIVLLFYSRELNIMSLGEENALTLGVEAEKVKIILLIVSAIVVATCVSISGIIGFVGLIVPNMVRILTGPDYKKLLPFSAVFGGMFLVLCDTMSRILMPPMELPIGAITALFGSPFFLYLIVKSKRNVI